MSAVKERILGAITVMTDADATVVWNFIMNQLPSHSWDNIEEIEPDEWDRQMLNDIRNDPDCREFLSSEETMKQLGL